MVVKNGNSAAVASGEYTSIALFIPTEKAMDVMEEILTIQADLRGEGFDAHIEVVRNAQPTPRRRESDVVPGSGADVDTVELPKRAGSVRTMRGQRKAADTTISTRAGRNSVVYRVIDPTTKVTPRNHEVRMYMLTHGPRTARALMEEMHLGRKVIESALHGLRTEGAVESVEDNGQKITQAKFSKRQIQQGTPE